MAYLITFRCYGTWLHGDERGSVNRKFNNIYGSSKRPKNLRLDSMEFLILKNKPFVLTAMKRLVVEDSIRNVCDHRGYLLYTVQARTNHVHCVVSAMEKPEKIMGAFKAYSTRHLRKAGLAAAEAKIWSRHGSTRYLWTENHIETTVKYVMNGQGQELTAFD